jgi:hypothetical protein
MQPLQPTADCLRTGRSVRAALKTGLSLALRTTSLPNAKGVNGARRACVARRPSDMSTLPPLHGPHRFRGSVLQLRGQELASAIDAAQPPPVYGLAGEHLPRHGNSQLPTRSEDDGRAPGASQIRSPIASAAAQPIRSTRRRTDRTGRHRRPCVQGGR